MFRDTVTKIMLASPVHELMRALDSDPCLHAAVFARPGKAHAYAEVLEPVGHQIISIVDSPAPTALQLRDVLLQFSVRHMLDRHIDGARAAESHLVLVFDPCDSEPPELALFPQSHTRTVIGVKGREKKK